MRRNSYFPKNTNKIKIEDDETIITNSLHNLAQKIKNLESKNVELEEKRKYISYCENYIDELANQNFLQQEELDNLVNENCLLQKQLECEKRATEDICAICIKYCNGFIFPCCNQRTCYLCAYQINKSEKCPYCRSTQYWDTNKLLDMVSYNNEHVLVVENDISVHTE